MLSKIISIVGLTASGKSAIGIELARRFNGEIISCDSRQVYRRLDVGTAKVTREEMSDVAHHLLDVAEAEERFDVHMFQRLAFEAIDDVLARGTLPILVGGTGLYSRAVIENYIFDGRGKTKRGERKYDVLQIALMPPKEWLLPVVKRRNEKRLDGLIAETKDLLSGGVGAEWLRSLGLDYQLGTDYVQGNLTLDEFKHWWTIRTMQYAKRQRTWFKREQNTHFLENRETFLDDCTRLIKEWTS
jgi:tRNA dimethylallyltransferase